MEKLKISWSLESNATDSTIKRYCQNCGRVALFRDSMVRRHNVNGKTIYQFAIYKCEKDHTWNQKLSIYKAHTEDTNKSEEPSVYAPPETISLPELRQKDIAELEIYLKSIAGKWRLDKFLSQQLVGISRSEIVKWIKQGDILVDTVRVKSGESLHEGRTIWDMWDNLGLC